MGRWKELKMVSRKVEKMADAMVLTMVERMAELMAWMMVSLKA